MMSSNFQSPITQHRAFAETPIGRAFEAYDAAKGAAWALDALCGGNINADLRAAWAKEKETRAALMALLWPLAGVGAYPEQGGNA